MSTSYVTAEKSDEGFNSVYRYKYIDKKTGKTIISYKKYKRVNKPSNLSKIELRKIINEYIKSHSAEEVKLLCDIIQNNDLKI